jgi:hypothetical protein
MASSKRHDVLRPMLGGPAPGPVLGRADLWVLLRSTSSLEGRSLCGYESLGSWKLPVHMIEAESYLGTDLRYLYSARMVRAVGGSFPRWGSVNLLTEHS